MIRHYFTWTVLHASAFNHITMAENSLWIWLCVNQILLVLVNTESNSMHARTCDIERLLRSLSQGLTVTHVGQTYAISPLIQKHKEIKTFI